MAILGRIAFLTTLAIAVWYSGWPVDSAPAKHDFDVEKYANEEFTMSKEELLNVAAVLGEINELAAGYRMKFIDEKSVAGFAGGNVTILESNDDPGQSNTSGATTPTQYLFEGDILLTPDQASGIRDDLIEQSRGEASGERPKRSAVLYGERKVKWTEMPIKYTLDSSIGSIERKAIDEALEFWRTHTCIWFQFEWTNTSADYLFFFKGEDDSCYSHVGKIGGKQPISIGRHCAKVSRSDQSFLDFPFTDLIIVCLSFLLGYVAHEIGHALGMWHEQARPDSNDYVQILWQNVRTEMTSNFLKRTWQQTETYGIPYDWGSVMHYGPYAFTSNDKYPTIEARPPGYRSTIGQREAPSFLDVKAVNKLYCEGKCKVQYPCANGGYIHPGFCNTCLCPGGLGGTYCDGPENSKNAGCGGLLYVGDDWKNISSPNYPEHYSNNQRCSWLLRAPAGHRVVLEFLDIFQLGCGPTCTDYVEVKNDTQFMNTGMRFCCFEKPAYEIFSQSNEMLVIFNSGYTTFNGFKARVIQCE